MENRAKKYHFIGIGGIGMSGLAQILLDKRLPVSGSDLHLSSLTDMLEERGATICKGHSAKHISRETTVVYTTEIKEGNPELEAARALSCPLIHRSELLAHLMDSKTPFAVTGTHGKTTTTALLTAVLQEANFDPSFAIGGMLSETNGKWGRGNYFVFEADESDGSFLHYHPEGAILTNIEPEHMAHFKTEEALHAAFETFCDQVQNPHLLFYWGDDPSLTEITAGRGVSYGFSSRCELQISNLRQKGWQIHFDCTFQGQTYPEIALNMIGEHNTLNGAAVFGLALRLGIEEETIRRAFAHFPGIARRCEKRMEHRGVLFLDDYGHHPTEIAHTLRAVKEAIQERRLVVVFQPHRYTRTQEHFERWAHAFEWADHLLVADIYSAGEPPIEGVSSHALVEKISKETTVPCHFLSSFEELDTLLRPHDVLFTIGAGDITHLHKRSFSIEKLPIGLVFGGESGEHEISMRSARFIASSLDRELYEIHYFGIDKEGGWICGPQAEEILSNASFVPTTDTQSLLSPAICQEIEKCSLFLPVLHGPLGEDGTLAGLFEILGKAYIGPDYRAAAISMDKGRAKHLAAAAGVPTPKALSFTFEKWRVERKDLLAYLKESLSHPLYVKGVHLGSSIGTYFVERAEELEKAIDKAFHFDHEVMVEEGIVNAREIEFAILGREVPPPGEKLAGGAFVDYEKKYGKNPVQTTVDASLSPEVLEKGQKLAMQVYEAIGCQGLSRVDFLLDPQENFWFFELNPTPGMQELSLFPKIWKREGLEKAQLVDRMIVLALAKRDRQKRHQTCSIS